MEKYSANYSYTNNNFVIGNLNAKANINSPIYPAICVLKNILMRGNPTIPSDYLKTVVGDELDETFHALIDMEVPEWKRTIKGYEENSDFPAYKFFYEIIPKYLAEYRFIQQLLIPEAKINEIIDLVDDEFVDQQVDFYLPLSRLVIEIDGDQHYSNEAIKEKD